MPNIDLDGMEWRAQEVLVACQDPDECVGEDEAAALARDVLALVARVRELEVARDVRLVRRLRDEGCDIDLIVRLVLLREDDVRATIRYLDVTDALGFEARWI